MLKVNNSVGDGLKKYCFSHPAVKVLPSNSREGKHRKHKFELVTKLGTV